MKNNTKEINALLIEWRGWLVEGKEKKNEEIDYITYVFYKMINMSMYYEFFILRLFFLSRQQNDSAESFFNRYQMKSVLPHFYKARSFFLTELNEHLEKNMNVLK